MSSATIFSDRIASARIFSDRIASARIFSDRFFLFYFISEALKKYKNFRDLDFNLKEVNSKQTNSLVIHFNIKYSMPFKIQNMISLICLHTRLYVKALLLTL